MSKRIQHNLFYFLIIFTAGTLVTSGNWFIGLMAGILLTANFDRTHFRQEREEEASKTDSTFSA